VNNVTATIQVASIIIRYLDLYAVIA